MSAASAPRFRRLQPEDAEIVATLIRAAFADQGGHTDPPSSALRESAAAVEEKLREGGGVGAFAPQSLLALILFTPKPDALYLGRLAVAAHARGQGLASQLLQRAEGEARRLGFARLRLRVRLDLPANRRLFARCGYVETARLAHPGYDRPTFAVMEKALDIA